MTRLSVMTFNTWAGMAGIGNLLAFFEAHRDVDVLCLQEMWDGGEEFLKKTAAGRSLEKVDPHIFSKIKNVLPEHTPFFRSQFIAEFGIAMFVRNTLAVMDHGSACVYREPGYVSPTDIADHARYLQFVTIKTPDGPVSIFNIHAAWQPGGKLDTPERLEQSRRIIEFTRPFTHPSILCGDFNLLPETESVRRLEEAGWENLIRTYRIPSTRTRLYPKTDPYADYVFVRGSVKVSDVRVLPDEISDHAPLLLRCEVYGGVRDTL